jgi:hypothetical protein
MLVVRKGIAMTGFKSKREAAQAKPEQEPVAWAVQGCSKMWRGEFAEIDAKAEAKRIGGTCVAYALYATPPAAQQAAPAELLGNPEELAQEPVAWAVYYKGGGSKSLHWPHQHSPNGDAAMFDAVPLVAQRPWVGLTQKEVQEIHDTYHKRMGPQEFSQAIESKLKEKNT